MNIFLLLAAGVLWWAWKTRDSRALRFGDVAAVVAALVSLRLSSRGETLPAHAAIGGAGWWLWFRRSRAASAAMPLAEARRLLDLDEDAEERDIRAAHRRLIARVHPDAGGSADLTARVNAARDTLLARHRPI